MCADQCRKMFINLGAAGNFLPRSLFPSKVYLGAWKALLMHGDNLMECETLLSFR